MSGAFAGRQVSVSCVQASRRGVRSFVLRESRLTPGQWRALEVHWPAYGLMPGAPGDLFDFAAVFGRRAPLTLEIGFGNGDSLLAMAASEPQSDFVGVEVYRPGIGRLLRGAAEAGLTNLKVIRADAAEVLQHHIADASFERALILFPDPWPKQRHHKRRLLTLPFITTLADKVRPGGLLYLATDWREYADSIREVVAGSGRFEPVGGGCSAGRTETRFEMRGREAGRTAVNLLYRRL